MKVVVTADDTAVKRHKPFPDVFLHAASMLGNKHTETVARVVIICLLMRSGVSV